MFYRCFLFARSSSFRRWRKKFGRFVVVCIEAVPSRRCHHSKANVIDPRISEKYLFALIVQSCRGIAMNRYEIFSRKLHPRHSSTKQETNSNCNVNRFTVYTRSVPASGLVRTQFCDSRALSIGRFVTSRFDNIMSIFHACLLEGSIPASYL